MEEAKEIKGSRCSCDNCGGALIFSPKHQRLFCPNCESQFDFDKNKNIKKNDLKSANTKDDEYNSWAKENKVFKCGTCGADVVLNNLDITGVCPYCGSNYVSETNDIPGLKPDSVIPFEVDISDALDIFKANLKKKFFCPSKIKKNLPASNIHGIYVPSFLFDLDTTSLYNGVLAKNKTIHTKEGTKTVRETFSISGTKNLAHNNVVVEASSKIDNKQLGSILPYNLDNSYKFVQDFLRGYYVEHYIDDVFKCYDVCKNEVDVVIRKSILSGYNYDSVVSLNINTKYFNELYTYRLLPIYNVEFKYGKKNYSVIMNGQTGSVGKGYPISAIKVSIVSFVIIAFIILIIILNII